MGKISSYTALAGTALLAADLFVVDHGASPTTQSITAANLMQGLWATAGNPVLDSNGNNLFGLAVTAAAVNYIQIGNAATNNAPTITATGTDTNIGLNVTGKGTGLVTAGRGSLSGLIESSTKTSLATQNITPTSAQLLGGYISHASVTGAGTFTLPLASALDTAIPGVATGDSFVVTYSNTGTQTVTITTNTGFTLHGTVAVPTGKVATLYFFRQGSATWDVVINLSA